jgi:cystathionine beta-synthase
VKSAVHGDLTDLIARKAESGAVVSVAPTDTLLIAYQRMKQAEISQVPVLEGRRIVGLVDESDLLIAAMGEGGFGQSVTDIMAWNLETVSPDTSPRDLLPIFARGLVAIVVDGDQFLGLVTRIDLLNWLRRKAIA